MTQSGEELSPGSMVAANATSPAPSPQSEAVTNELQELTLQPLPIVLPLRERTNGESGGDAHPEVLPWVNSVFCVPMLSALENALSFLISSSLIAYLR